MYCGSSTWYLRNLVIDLQGEDHFVDCHQRVRYAETDQMGVAYHSHYLVWFEVGRSSTLR